MTVKATKEGLVGNKTASGYVVDPVVPYVALPNKKALGKFIKLINPLNGKAAYAVVLDIGPWNIDDPYADPVINRNYSLRPLAEQGVMTDGKKRIEGLTNGAGIDLGGKIWEQLDMKDNSNVDWEWMY